MVQTISPVAGDSGLRRMLWRMLHSTTASAAAVVATSKIDSEAERLSKTEQPALPRPGAAAAQGS